MFAKQISVFVQNTAGKAAEFTRILGEKNVDLMSISIADTADFGIIRMITKDVTHAIAVAEAAGYTTVITDVIAAKVEDRPGGLADVLEALKDHQVSVEYMYSFTRPVDGHAVIVMRVDDNINAIKALDGKAALLSQDELCRL